MSLQEAINTRTLRERAEYLEEENRLLKEALRLKPPSLARYRQAFNLTPSESKILDCILEGRGEVVSLAHIATRLYGACGGPNNGDGEMKTVNSLLSKLRYKLKLFNTALEISNCRSAGWRITPEHRSLIIARIGETTTMSNN